MEEIEKAKVLLYENRIDSAKNILDQIDTTLLREEALANYHLANSFLFQLTGYKTLASNHLNKCTLYFEQNGDDLGKGEWRLINGYILETALLFSEAAQSYLEGMQYLTQEKWPRQYFKCLLGVIRTSPEKGHFIKEAESFLEHNPTNTNRYLFLAAKSSITSDKRKKLDLLLESLKHFDQEYNDRDLVRLYSNIGRTYQDLGEKDKADHYMAFCEKIISARKTDYKNLAHYYLLRANVEFKNGRTEDALQTLSIVFKAGADRPGIMANALLQRSKIYRTMADYVAENDDLNEYVKYIKLESEENKQQQIGLLSYRLLLHKKELEVMRSRQLLLAISLSCILIVIFGGLVVIIYQKRLKRKGMELKQVHKLTMSRLDEQLKLNHTLIKRDDEESLQAIQYGNKTNLKMQEFRFDFSLHYPFFREKLSKIHPSLSSADLKYCECILAQLSLHQTARMLEVSESAVKKARKKLMNIFKCSSIDDIYIHLKRINDCVLSHKVKIEDYLTGKLNI